jgi:hypothetical protein
MAKSPPSTPFYWNDYYRDTRVLQPASRGVWMDCLCKVHEAGRRGEATMPLASWLQWCGCPLDVFLDALRDIAVTEVGVVLFGHCDMSHSVTLHHTDVTQLVTIKNRRMLRENKVRESERLRQQRHRESRAGHAMCHAPVTAPNMAPSSSSSSSSSPSHWEPPNPLAKGAVTSRAEESAGRDGPEVFTGLSGELREIFERNLLTQFVPEVKVGT